MVSGHTQDLRRRWTSSSRSHFLLCDRYVQKMRVYDRTTLRKVVNKSPMSPRGQNSFVPNIWQSYTRDLPDPCGRPGSGVLNLFSCFRTRPPDGSLYNRVTFMYLRVPNRDSRRWLAYLKFVQLIEEIRRHRNRLFKDCTSFLIVGNSNIIHRL